MRIVPAVVLLPAVLHAGTPLDSTMWKLIETRNPDFAVPKEASVLVSFSATHLAIRGCNTLRAAYQSSGGKITAGPILSTRKACPGASGKLDNALGTLLTTARYRIVGDQLNLTGTDGHEWSFIRMPVPSRDARTRFIYVAAQTKDCTAGTARLKCLQVRDTRDQPWRLSYNPIIGFDHEAGIEYRLRIKEDTRANAPADASSVVWYLDTIIEERRVKP